MRFLYRTDATCDDGSPLDIGVVSAPTLRAAHRMVKRHVRLIRGDASAQPITYYPLPGEPVAGAGVWTSDAPTIMEG